MNIIRKITLYKTSAYIKVLNEIHKNILKKVIKQRAKIRLNLIAKNADELAKPAI